MLAGRRSPSGSGFPCLAASQRPLRFAAPRCPKARAFAVELAFGGRDLSAAVTFRMAPTGPVTGLYALATLMTALRLGVGFPPIAFVAALVAFLAIFVW